MPGPVTSRFSAGTNALLAAGAGGRARQARRPRPARRPSDRRTEPEPRAAGRPLEPRLRRLLDAVERGHGSLAELTSDPDSTRQVLQDLTELELRGLVRREFGGRYVRALEERDGPAPPNLSGMPRPIPAVLSIAGSDSGGGAGIQADLKAFARCGVHGMTAITALTAQNTVGVTGVHPVPGDFIVEQVRAVAEDIGVDAVKIGMLGTAEIVAAVDEALDLLAPGTPVVIDPVMVAESGAILLDDDARRALADRLLRAPR